MCARRTEDRDAALDVRKIVEPLDELSHDAHHAPWISSCEILVAAARLEELLILGDGRVAADGVVDDARRARGPRRRSLRRRCAPRGAMTCLGALAIPFARGHRCLGEQLGACLLSSRRAWSFG